MQSQKFNPQGNEQVTPELVEIDAQMLELVSGGLPKSTWGTPIESVATAETPLPKSTW